MALIPEISNQKSGTGEISQHAQLLSQYVHDQITPSAAPIFNRISPDFGQASPDVLNIPPYHYPDLQRTALASTAPSEEHGLQFRAPAPEAPPLSAKQLGQELTAAMESHDPKSMDKFENDLSNALGNSGEFGASLLVSQINENMPKGMGIEMTDDERPGDVDDYHHYSLHFLQQVNAGGNFTSSEYGPCEQEGSMMLSSAPEWMKKLNGFQGSRPQYEIID